MKIIRRLTTLLIAVSRLMQTNLPAQSTAILSHDTGYTITKVRTASYKKHPFIVAASYEAAILTMKLDGTKLWTSAPTGFMVHDVWCDDLTGDSVDDILVACGDGFLYCLDGTNGQELWTFTPTTGVHKTPMYAVCTVKDSKGKRQVACGGFDKNFYYLSESGKKLKTIKSSTYSKEKTWGDGAPKSGTHTVNFLRPIPQPDGSDHLALCGTMNHMQSSGTLYRFETFAEKPYETTRIAGIKTLSDVTVCDANEDGSSEFVFGGSGLNSDPLTFFDPKSDKLTKINLKGNGPNGYRVSLTEVIADSGKPIYLVLCGAQISLIPLDLKTVGIERFKGTYSFYDIWKDPKTGFILLASAQSGGSCVHVIDTRQSRWKNDFKKLTPPGKVQTILDNTARVSKQVEKFKKAAWERDPVPVYITDSERPLRNQIASRYDSPVFIGGYWQGKFVEKTDWREAKETYIESEVYRNRKDFREKYELTQEEVLKRILPAYKGHKALEFWAGHSNDPNYYSPLTLRKILDRTEGVKTILAWPEVGHTDDEFKSLLDGGFYPLAEYCAQKKAWMVFKSKDVFWLGDVYLPLWHRLLSGEFADVFCSSMEETTDKSQDMSLAGRMGLWAAGSLNQWGMRTSRDNPSFDRSRQFSYQRLPNHFLRASVYSLACGSTYCGITYVDDEYFSVLWPMIAKGAIFVPKREEIVSWSPVHLSMINPDERFLKEAKSNKWTTFYDEKEEDSSPLVFSHLNGSWPGAALTPWDFSRYASGITDRRQNFIPPFPNGIVLITPPQNGQHADPTAPRGKMTDHLHPLYKDIMQEVVTDGRFYYPDGGSKKVAADKGYENVADQVRKSSQLLPLTVSGEVAWVVAQTDPKHLRLTLVDSGYLNPKDRTAKVSFHTVKPVKMTDVLGGDSIDVSDPNSVAVEVPLGLFRFIDIELDKPL